MSFFSISDLTSNQSVKKILIYDYFFILLNSIVKQNSKLKRDKL